MRTLVAILWFGLVAGVAHAEPKTEAKPAEGHVAWFDISTTSMAKSEAFYGRLFGWTFKPIAGTDLAATIVDGTEEIGSLRKSEGAISAFNGVVYISVSDLPAACKKATALGGVIPPGFPFNVPSGRGAIALVADPVGHPIGMYSKTPLPATKPAKK